MRKPTPLTISIMKTESLSIWIGPPIFKSPAESHVQSVDECVLSSGLSPSSTAKTITEQAKETSAEPAARKPAMERLMLVPGGAIRTTAAAGAKSAIQAAAIIRDDPPGGASRRVSPGGSSSQSGELVHVEIDVPARDRDDEAEADDRLGGGDDHHGQREDLPAARAGLARESDQGEVAGVQHDLEREQHDERAAANEHAEGSCREEDHGEDQVGGDAGAGHQLLAPFGTALPRITPPTAATRSTMDVTSKASRWSPRKSCPICAGVPKPSSISAGVESWSPAFSATTTTTSTAMAAAATIAASDWRLGLPAQ